MTLDRACVRRDVRNVNKRTFWVCCRPSYWSGYFSITSLLFCSLAVKWRDESNFCMPWSLMNILWNAQKSLGEKGWRLEQRFLPHLPSHGLRGVSRKCKHLCYCEKWRYDNLKNFPNKVAFHAVWKFLQKTVFWSFNAFPPFARSRHQ